MKILLKKSLQLLARFSQLSNRFFCNLRKITENLTEKSMSALRDVLSADEGPLSQKTTL